MNEREFMKFAKNEQVFTTKQIAAALGEVNYSWIFLNRMVNRDLIKRLKRGYYTAHEDPIIYASHIYFPSYISLWYAFQYYGTTTQLPVKIEVMAKKNETVENIVFIKTNEMWGYKSVNYYGFKVFLAELEKAIIDAIDTERVPVDEVQNAISKCEIKKLENYALKMPVATMKKIGFVSEKAGYPLEKLFERIKKDRNYAHYYAAEKGNRWKVNK